MDTAVDWARLGRAVEYYKSLGYTYVEVPWAVSRTAIEVTCPNPINAGEVQDLGCLVGSAEQSFIALMQLGALPPGKYVACTPCFRLGDTYDALHQPYFMKVELIRTDSVTDQAQHEMMLDAQRFMNLSLDRSMREMIPQAVREVETPDGVDLELAGVEVGSYGRRVHGDLQWTYGTGLAEPRFSTATKMWQEARRKDSAGTTEGLLHGGDAGNVKINVVSSYDRAPIEPPQLARLLAGGRRGSPC